MTEKNFLGLRALSIQKCNHLSTQFILGISCHPLLQWEHSYEVIKSILSSDDRCWSADASTLLLTFVGIWICGLCFTLPTFQKSGVQKEPGLVLHSLGPVQIIFCILCSFFVLATMKLDLDENDRESWRKKETAKGQAVVFGWKRRKGHIFLWGHKVHGFIQVLGLPWT